MVQNEYIDTHPEPFFLVSYEEIKSREKNLLFHIPLYSTKRIEFEFIKLINSFGDSHSLLYNTKLYEKRIPLVFKLIDEKLYIVDGYSEYSDLIGLEVISINNNAVSELVKKFNLLTPGINDYWKSENTEQMLSYTKFYNFLNLGSKNKIHIEYINKNITYKKTIKSIEYADYKISNLIINDPDSILDFNIEESRDNNYYISYHNQTNSLYIQLNSLRKLSKSSQISFRSKVEEIMDLKKPDNIVIDLTKCIGGYTKYYQDLLSWIFFKYDYLYRNVSPITLISNKTYSGGVLLTDQLKKYYNSILIGEPTGGSYFMFSSSENSKSIPYTDLYYVISTYKYPYYDYSKIALYPDVYVYLSMTDYIDKKPSLMNYVEKILSNDN